MVSFRLLRQAEQAALARLTAAMKRTDINELKYAIAGMENLGLHPPELQQARQLRAQLEEAERRRQVRVRPGVELNITN